MEENEKNLELQKIEELMNKIDAMVEPEKFKELEEKYNKLLNDYVNKRPAPKKEAPKELRKASEIANELRSVSDGGMNNRDYWKLSLEYRESFMNETGKDPWTDGAGEETPKTKHIASTIKGLLEDYESPVAFRTQFNEMLRDDPKVTMALAERKKSLSKNKKNK